MDGMDHKPRGFTYFFVSVIFIFVAVVTTSLINLKGGDATDIRARAGEQGGLTFTATVTSVENPDGAIRIDNLTLEEADRAGSAKNLGTWKLLTPTRFNASSVTAGSTLTIYVSGTGMDVPNRTINATEVQIRR